MNETQAWLHEPAEQMTADQVERLRASWFDLETSDVDVAERFYAHLFTLDPDVRSLFRGDMQAQRRKFADTLAVIVERLDDRKSLVQYIAVLGQRHVDYGVSEAHYLLVEQALIAALTDSLGDDFDAAARSAWQSAYRAVARAMLAARLDDELYA